MTCIIGSISVIYMFNPCVKPRPPSDSVTFQFFASGIWQPSQSTEREGSVFARYQKYIISVVQLVTPFLPQFLQEKPSVSLFLNLKLQPWASFAFSTAISRCIVPFSQKLKVQPMLPSFLLTFPYFCNSAHWSFCIFSSSNFECFFLAISGGLQHIFCLCDQFNKKKGALSREGLERHQP